MTNFSAVCVSENRTTLTSTRPAALPAAMTSASVRRKGRKDLTEGDVRAAGKAAGLVDVKVVRFSDTHTAEKFVIPVADR